MSVSIDAVLATCLFTVLTNTLLYRQLNSMSIQYRRYKYLDAFEFFVKAAEMPEFIC